MRVDAISIPAAAADASTAAGPVLSAPWSFSATLASFMPRNAPEDHQVQSATIGTTAKSDSKIGEKLGAELGVASGIKVGASLKAKSAGKSSAKLNAKPSVNSAIAPEIHASLPTYPVSDSILGTLLTTSLTTSPTTSPTLAKTADAPPLSSALPVVSAAQITPGTFPLAGTSNASTPQDHPGSTVTSASPLAVPRRTEAPLTSNFSQALDIRPPNSGAANAPVNAPGPTETNPKSGELPSASDRAASDAARLSTRVPTRTSTAQAQFSTSMASVLPMPTVLASLGPASLTPVSPMPSPATTTPVSTAPPSADSQFQAPIPVGATIFALDQSPIIQSPSAQAGPFSPTPLTSLDPLTRPAPPSLIKNFPVQPLDQATFSPAYSSSPVASTNSAFNTSTRTTALTSFSPMTAPIPVLQSPIRDINLVPITEGGNAKQPAALKSSDSKVGSSISPTSSSPTLAAIPTLQSPIRNINPAPVTEPANTKQRAALNASDSKVRNATPAKFAPGGPIASELAPTPGSASLDAAPAQALSSDATITVAAQNIASNNVTSVDSNFAPNSGVSVPTPASVAAATSDVPSNGKPGISAQPAPAAATQTTRPYEKSEKKSSSAVLPNAAPSRTAPLRDASATLASGKDSWATLTAAAPPASATPPHIASDAAPELPKTHQMLDSAPPSPPTPPIAPYTASAGRMNAQMHVGIRTEAFGAVEIHTVVQQSQVGITVHAERDIAHWFSSEFPGLESGLNKNHLNLTVVDFDSGRSGVQTATSFQQGQPEQHFSNTPGSQSPALPNQDTASESAAADILTSDLSVGPAQNHVSIHV